MSRLGPPQTHLTDSRVFNCLLGLPIRSWLVVRLPSAQSVPSSAIRGARTRCTAPVQKCSSERRFGRRRSMIRAPLAAANAASSGSSARTSCRPFTTPMPARSAAASGARSSGGNTPPDVATPTTHQSGRAPVASRASRLASTGMPRGCPSRTSPASRPAHVASSTASSSKRLGPRTKPWAVFASDVWKRSRVRTAAVSGMEAGYRYVGLASLLPERGALARRRRSSTARPRPSSGGATASTTSSPSASTSCSVA